MFGFERLRYRGGGKTSEVPGKLLDHVSYRKEVNTKGREVCISNIPITNYSKENRKNL